MRTHRVFRRAATVLLMGSMTAGCGATVQSGPSTRAPASPATTPALASATPPAGPTTDLVALGNFPTGGAVTADGRFLWTVSAGFGANDVRIVDTATRQVRQTIPVPGASGGIALDSAHHLAFVSGLTKSRWRPSEATLPGARGNVILAYSYTDTCGQATLDRVIPVPPPASAPLVQQFPPIPQRSIQPPGATNAWPQQVAVSPDGSRLLVALNLADSVAVVDLAHADGVRYVPMAPASYSFGAAILPDGRTGLVTNEATGTLSVIDLDTAALVTDIAVGPPLSHPQGLVADATGARAYVALSASDLVVVVDLARRKVERTISVGRSAGLGTQPVALALDPSGTRLFVVESGANEIAAIRLPDPGTTAASNLDWKVIGRIPTAETPQAVTIVPAHDGRTAELAWVSGHGPAVGPNPKGPNPTNPNDPIFWAFNPVAPTADPFADGTQYLPGMVMGQAASWSFRPTRPWRR